MFDLMTRWWAARDQELQAQQTALADLGRSAPDDVQLQVRGVVAMVAALQGPGGGYNGVVVQQCH
jgi:hypothetical protein